MVEVFACRLIPKEEFESGKSMILDQIDPGLKEKIAQFVRPDDAQRSLIGELLVRYMINEKYGMDPANIKIKYSDKGKPFLINREDIHFNISHSGKWVVAAISPTPVGIDVEKIKTAKIKIAKRFFTDEEYNDLMEKSVTDQPGYFFELWTCKESYLKALGKGLTKSLRSFSIRNVDSKMNVISKKDPENVNFKQYDIDKNYKLAVCSFENTFMDSIKTINYYKITENLKVKT